MISALMIYRQLFGKPACICLEKVVESLLIDEDAKGTYSPKVSQYLCAVWLALR